MVKTTLFGMILLPGVSALTAWMSYALSPNPLTLEVFRVSPVEAAAEEAGVDVIGTEDARTFQESGSHLFLDARSQQEYDQGHIPMAMPLPLREFESAFPQLAPMLEPDTPLVVYCSGPLCDDGLHLILRLREAGFGGGILYLDGMEGWE
ncbi:MAG: rhodanese-like domain-containing protein [Kiritimatiellia bacterium]